MSLQTISGWVEAFSAWAVIFLALMVVALVVLGLFNGVLVFARTLSSARARNEDGPADGPLPHGFISMYTYLHLLADVLLVVVAIELIQTLLVFESRSNPTEYLTGVLGAALVALSRRIIVFFNPETSEPHTGEMYAYAALVAALALAYAVISYTS